MTNTFVKYKILYMDVTVMLIAVKDSKCRLLVYSDLVQTGIVQGPASFQRLYLVL